MNCPRPRLLLQILVVPFLILGCLWGFSNLSEKWNTPKPSIVAYKNGLSNASSWVLENGAKVLYLPVRSLPMLDVEILLDAGGLHDGEYPGLAFVTNALLREGPEKYDAIAFSEALENAGGQLSVSTRADMVSIHLRTLTDGPQKEQTIALLTEMLRQPAFRSGDFARLKNQLAVGFAQDEEQPGAIGGKKIIQAIFGNQVYGSVIYGTPDSIQAISLEAVRAFYDRFYNTHNHMTIAIVGDVTEVEAKALAQAITSSVSSKAFSPESFEIHRLAPQVVHIPFPSQQSYITLGTMGVPIGHPDYPALAVGYHILVGGGMHSILFDIVRNQKGLTYDMHGSLSDLRWGGALMFDTHSRAAVAKTALETIQEVLRDFAQKGPTEEQLVMAKENLKGSFPLQFMNNGTLSRGLASLGFYDLPLDYNDRLLESFLQVTPESIQKAWNTHFSPEQFSVVVVGP